MGWLVDSQPKYHTTMTETKTYLGVKRVNASPLTLGNYNTLRGWPLPDGEDANKEGYLVEYIDSTDAPNHPDYAHYISWSPRDTFEAAYKELNAVPIGHAIEAAKAGKRIARAGWNGQGMFVFQQVPSTVPFSAIANMTSLPEPVRAEFIRRNQSLRYQNQFALVKQDNSIHGWTPSPADVLADDWMILD